MNLILQKNVLTFLSVLFSILCTFGGYKVYMQLSEQERAASFDGPVKEFNEHFNENLEDMEYTLHSVNQLFDSSSNVDEIEFDSFSGLILEYNLSIAGIGVFNFDSREMGAKTTLPEPQYWLASDSYPQFTKREVTLAMKRNVDLREASKLDNFASDLFSVNDSQQQYVLLTRIMPEHNLLLAMVIDLHRAAKLSISNRIVSNFIVYREGENRKELAFSDVKYSATLAKPFNGEIFLFNRVWPMVIYPPANLFNQYYVAIPVIAFLFSLMVLYLVYFAFKLHKLSDDRQLALQDLKFAQSKMVEAEKIGAMGGLVAGIAHEVNTPLGISITSCSHVNDLMRDLKEDFDRGELDQEKFEDFLSSGKEMLGMALENMGRASKLISSFKKIDVINADDSTKTELVDVAEIVENFVEHYQQNAMSTKIKFDVEIGKRAQIHTYPTVITQVLASLASNSEVHAFAKKNEDCVISIRVSSFGNSVLLKFADNGSGVKKKNLAQIFDPFYTTNRGAGNAGLGLSVVYNLVKSKLKGELNHGAVPGGGLWISLRIKDLEEKE